MTYPYQILKTHVYIYMKMQRDRLDPYYVERVRADPPMQIDNMLNVVSQNVS
jgi:hypothetical protein